MNKDIENSADIKTLIDSFYERVTADHVIGRFFTEVVPVDFDMHLPVMYSFWESLLLGKSGYRGNPMIKHIEINKISKLEESHFERWLELWNQNLDHHFKGTTADKAKEKANMMKILMLQKIRRSEEFGFLH